jgi:predicted adenylyl cyclase CyaB
MAFDGIEVEIKLAVTRAQFEAVREAMATKGIEAGESDQLDHYFVPKDNSYLSVRFPYEWLSVRERGGSALINHKHFHPEGAEHHTHCDETELSVSDPKAASGMLEALGFTRAVTVHKHRLTYRIRADFEVALDTVDDLGSFVEIEALRDQGGVEMTREAVVEFAKSLGLDIDVVDPRGYPYQLLLKSGMLPST